MEEYEQWCIDNDGEDVTLSDHLQQLVKVRMMLSKAKIAATIETILKAALAETAAYRRFFRDDFFNHQPDPASALHPR